MCGGNGRAAEGGEGGGEERVRDGGIVAGVFLLCFGRLWCKGRSRNGGRFARYALTINLPTRSGGMDCSLSKVDGASMTVQGPVVKPLMNHKQSGRFIHISPKFVIHSQGNGKKPPNILFISPHISLSLFPALALALHFF